LHAEVFFKAPEHATDRRLADAEFFRRPGEAATTGGSFENEQGTGAGEFAT
jgi:hypothetical protein